MEDLTTWFKTTVEQQNFPLFVWKIPPNNFIDWNIEVGHYGLRKPMHVGERLKWITHRRSGATKALPPRFRLSMEEVGTSICIDFNWYEKKACL
eukprot:4747764-Lingulodinium_polyedra.AAC.1